MLGFAPLGGAPLGAQPSDTAGTPVDTGPLARDTLQLTETIDGEVDHLNVTVLDGLTAGDAPAVQWTANAAFVELVSLFGYTFQGAQQYNPVDVVLTDTGTFKGTPVGGLGVLVSLAEAIGVSQVLTSYYGLVVRETIRGHETYIGNGTYNLALTELARLADRLRTGVPVTATDALAFTSLLDAQTVIRLVEALTLAQNLQASGVYNLAVRQTMRLADSLARFFGADVEDAVEVASILTALARVQATAADGVAIEEQVAPQFLLAVTAADGIELSPEQAVQMLYAPELVDGVEIVAGFLEPSGSFTTWVMNTRTAAVTEYQDYAFNSFGQMGNTYLGASDDGLYELTGDTDDGEDIIATLKGGYLQFGGTQLSRLKEAYIAARGEGRFVLRIRTADGVSYDYQTDTRNMRNTKVHMGKGMRARYFGFELISTGQDFDLDTLEFVPIVVQRRV